MQWMKELQRRGIIGENVDLEAFRAALEKQGIVGRDGEGKLMLLGSGERRIRRNALEEIFTSLQKAGPGLHSIPNAGTGAEALPELILQKYPKDTIDIVLFGDEARHVPLEELSKAQVGPFHTNTKAGLGV